MNRGGARQRTFLNKGDYEVFLKTVAETYELWGVEVFAYCLMSNHYHVCLRTPEGNLSRVMRHLDGLYTQRFNRSHGRDGVLFRGRYKAIVVDAEEYLAAVVRYIHLNPVKAGLVKEPQGYAWGSHKAYLRSREAPRWLKVKEVLERFSDIREFHEFVLSGNEEALERFYSQGRQSPVLGGEGFREQLMRKLGRMSRENPRYERVGVRPSVERVLKGVAQLYRVKMEDILGGRRGRENEARKVGMYLVKQMCDLTLQQITEQFGVGSYGAVGWACHEVQLKAESNRGFQKQVEQIKALICQPKT